VIAQSWKALENWFHKTWKVLDICRIYTGESPEKGLSLLYKLWTYKMCMESISRAQAVAGRKVWAC